MKRKLNEGAEFNEELLDGVKICVSDIRNDDSEMDCNELRDIFVEAGAEVFGSHGLKDGKPATIMTVKGLPEEQVVEILQEFLDNSNNCADAEAYEIDDEDAYINDKDGEPIDYPAYDDIESNEDFPAYEDVETDDLDPEEDVLNDDFLNEGEDILEEAQEELRGLLSNLGENDNITFEPKIGLDEANIISIDSNGDMETEDGDIINAFDILDADDIFTLCDEVKIELDNEAAYPDYDEVDDEEELPRFEKFHKGRHLDEKKKNNCCPGTKTVNESNESIIDAVLADLDAKSLNESKKNQKELEKKTLKALTENKHSLHTNVRYNGKSFDKMTLKELKTIYETVKSSIDALSERLNESQVDTKMVETINKKKQLLEFLDEEITYRTTRMECLSKLNEDSAEISDEELANLFGPAQGEDEPSTDNGDNNGDNNTEGEDSNEEGEENKEDDNKDENNDEEVELSRIEITLKDAEAANDLKQACLDAEIPEDAFELENVEEESATEDEENSEESEENSEEGSEEPSEENTEEENSEEGTNESYEFTKYVKMLGEGEIADEQPAEDAAGEEGGEEENGAEDANGEGDEENSEEEEEDKQPKFILTNTDYASKLAKVLEDVYGISKEEFEDMIGGEIVEEEPKEDEENSDEEGSENSEESKEDSEEKNDDGEEELDPSDLFKNL